MNKYFSTKLKILSFVSIILVVYLHSYNILVKFNTGNITLNKGYNSFIQYFISQGLTRIAIPLFFIISGYLFFINISPTMNGFVQKYKKRFMTLVIPYLLWSLWGLLFFFILQLFPQNQNFFTNDLIKDYSIQQVFDKIFINPIPHQLWFVRDLIVLTLVSPVIWFLVRKHHFLVIFILLFAWYCRFNYVVFSSDAILFFTIGAVLAFKSDVFLRLDYSGASLIALCLWIVLVLFETILNYTGYESGLSFVLHNTTILIGIFSVWYFYDTLFRKKDLSEIRFYEIFSFSFFIYAFHEPVLSMFKKGIISVLSRRTEVIFLLVYFFAPILTIILSLIIGYFLKTKLPRFYFVITGNR